MTIAVTCRGVEGFKKHPIHINAYWYQQSYQRNFRTPIDMGARYERLPAIEILEELGVDIEARDFLGRTV